MNVLIKNRWRRVGNLVWTYWKLVGTSYGTHKHDLFLKFKYSTCPPFSPKLKRNWAFLVHVASLHWLHVNFIPNDAPHHFQLRLIARLYSSSYMFHKLKAWKKILNGPLDSTLWPFQMTLSNSMILHEKKNYKKAWIIYYETLGAHMLGWWSSPLKGGKLVINLLISDSNVIVGWWSLLILHGEMLHPLRSIVVIIVN
jgi:hypothetical protein